MRENWDVRPLGQFSEIKYGYTAKADSEPVGPRFLRITDIQNGEVNWNQVPFCKVSEKDHAKHSVREGDIVFARTGATTGKSFLIREAPDTVCASYLIKVRPNTKTVLPDFLNIYFQTSEYWDAIALGTEGAAQGGFNASKLGALPIPLPPLEEQQRIVAVLAEAFEGLARARAHAEANLQNARELFERALLSLLVGEPDVATEGSSDKWPEVELKEIVSFHNGDRGKNYPNKSEYVADGVPWLNTGQIMPDGSLSPSKMNFISEEKFESLGGGKIQPGDLVFCLRGATIGKTAFVAPYEIGAVASSLMIIRPGEQISDRYLYYFLTSDLGKGEISKFIGGAAQPNLAGKSVGKFKIRLPPNGEQARIVAELDQIKQNSQTLQEHFKTKIDDIDDLRQSILQKAFAGELT